MTAVVRIVEVTKAVRWWIDRQVENGKPDQQIADELPAAIAFIKAKS